jgi:predicted oxidoreductase
MEPLELSSIVAGTWRLKSWRRSTAELLAWIEQCVELGVTSFDHADLYGDYDTESLFGAALAQAAPSLRARIQLVTKCGIRDVSARRPAHRIKSYDSSGAHIRASVEQSLRNLCVERLELVMLHRPDFLADPTEIADTFTRLQQGGKVRHFGASNYSAWQFAALHAHAPLATHQLEFSPLKLEPLTDGTLDQALQLGIRPMAWSPLAGGRILTATDERAVRVRGALQAMATAHSISVMAATVGWVRRHPSRPYPIIGSGRIEAMREAIAALPITLDRQSWYAVWCASTGREVP